MDKLQFAFSQAFNHNVPQPLISLPATAQAVPFYPFGILRKRKLKILVPILVWSAAA